MIDAIFAGNLDFSRIPLHGFRANFQGRLLESIDVAAPGGKLQQTVKIIAIIAGVALAAFLLYLIVRRCCFRAKIGNDFPPDSPKGHRLPAPKASPFVEKSGFKLPPQSDSDDLSAYLDKACCHVDEVDQKLSKKVTTPWNLSQKDFQDFLSDIRSLKSLDQDYHKFESYADRIDKGLKSYDELLKNGDGTVQDAEVEAQAPLIRQIYEKELAIVYARVAEQYFVKGRLNKCALVALKIKHNDAVRDGLLLEVANRYLKEKKLAEAQWVLGEASSSDQKDRIYFDFIQELLKNGNSNQALEIINEAKWHDWSLENNLRCKIAEDIFADLRSRREYWNLSGLLNVLRSITDEEMKDQSLIDMGKMIYRDGNASQALKLFQMMTYNVSLRDRFINNIHKGLPI